MVFLGRDSYAAALDRNEHHSIPSTMTALVLVRSSSFLRSKFLKRIVEAGRVPFCRVLWARDNWEEHRTCFFRHPCCVSNRASRTATSFASCLTRQHKRHGRGTIHGSALLNGSYCRRVYLPTSHGCSPRPCMNGFFPMIPVFWIDRTGAL